MGMESFTNHVTGASIMVSLLRHPRPCVHCGSSFTSSQPRAKYCGKRCKQAAKDQRRKPQRLERDRKMTGIDPSRYRKTDPASVAAKFNLKPTDGFTDQYTPLHDGDF